MTNRIITIGGKPGSGKSSTANGVAARLGYERFSSGDFMRAVAKRRGITLEELGKLAEADHTIDEDIDAAVRAAGAKDRVVIDSRMAFHWIPDAFKVFLDLPLPISAERIHNDQTEARRAVGEGGTQAELEASLKRRLESEQKRYQSLYGVSPIDLSHYDLVITTNEYPLAEVIEKVAEGYDAWCKQRGIAP